MYSSGVGVEFQFRTPAQVLIRRNAERRGLLPRCDLELVTWF